MGALAQVTYNYHVSTGISFGLLLVIILVDLAVYIFGAFCLMRMADKLGVENSWFAFIPFLNLWLI